MAAQAGLRSFYPVRRRRGEEDGQAAIKRRKLTESSHQDVLDQVEPESTQDKPVDANGDGDTISGKMEVAHKCLRVK